MGLFDWLWRLFGGREAETTAANAVAPPVATPGQTVNRLRGSIRLRQPRRRARADHSDCECPEVDGTPPYQFARLGSRSGRHLDLSRDADEQYLRQQKLPVLRTPADIARWLNVPVGRLAWLVHRFSAGRPVSVSKSHWHYRWVKKKSGGWRLIESPKQELKQIQQRILKEILERVPAHHAAHGFVKRRSIRTNALPHVGQAVVVRMDLANFYPTVSFSRVVAIFRSLGFSREAGIWLARLTTSSAPSDISLPEKDAGAVLPYLRTHLPQGAPSSPALANLSAYYLDARLSGLCKSFEANYTRYADDLTFSGGKRLLTSLRVFIPLVRDIIRSERFRIHASKQRVLRANQRQTVAGVVVNAKPNISRQDYETLKAILTNCLRNGPRSQNRENIADFCSHLRGRISHIASLNPQRGQKLLQLFRLINWSK